MNPACPIGPRAGQPARRASAVGCLVLALWACGQRPAPPAEPGFRPAIGPKVFPVEMAPALDDPGRDAWQKPDEVLAALALTPGARVADVGAGTGYFTVRLARAVGEQGRVVATDIQQGMLDRLRTRLDPELAARVELRLTPPLEPLAPADGLDLVFLANTLHEVDDRDQQAFVDRLFAATRPGGRLATIDWLPRPTGFGPPLANRIAPERVRALAELAGYRFEREVAILPFHAFQVFARPQP